MNKVHDSFTLTAPQPKQMEHHNTAKVMPSEIEFRAGRRSETCLDSAQNAFETVKNTLSTPCQTDDIPTRVCRDTTTVCGTAFIASSLLRGPCEVTVFAGCVTCCTLPKHICDGIEACTEKQPPSNNLELAPSPVNKL